MSHLKLVRMSSGPLMLLLIATSAWSQSTALMSPYRTWKDASGKHDVVAAVEKSEGGTVFLRLKDNGTTVPVPLSRLSPEDRAYVKDLMGTGEETPKAPPDDIAATTVVLRRDFGRAASSTDAGVLIFADETFGYLFGGTVMSFPGHNPKGKGQSVPLSLTESTDVVGHSKPAAIELPPNALDTWRASFHCGSPDEFFKMVQPVTAGDGPLRGLGKIPVGKLPTPLLSRKTALPVAGSEIKIVGFHLQSRAGAPPHIVQRTCRATVSPKQNATTLREFDIEGAELVNISTGVVLDDQDRVLGVLLVGAAGRPGGTFRSNVRCRVTNVHALRSDIAPALQHGHNGSAVYANGWSDSGVSLDLDVRIRDRLSRAGKTALLIKRHAGPLPAATQISADDWAPILPDMAVVPLASAPVVPSQPKPTSQRQTLGAKWQDPQGVDGRNTLQYAVQLQWTDRAGKVRRCMPEILTPRLSSRKAWPTIRPALHVPMCRQAVPLPDGTICLTPESTRGWPGTAPFVTNLPAAGLKATSPGTTLDTETIDVGQFTCRFYRKDVGERFIDTPVWSSDGTAFFVLTRDGLLRKIAKADFRVLRSMQLTEPRGAKSGPRRIATRIFSSSEGLIAMVAGVAPVEFWVLDEETLAVKRGLGMPAPAVIASRKSPIVYVPIYNGLTIVDLSSGKVLRHLGQRETVHLDNKNMLTMLRLHSREDASLQITPDGRYLARMLSGNSTVTSEGKVAPIAYRIDKDQLTFDPGATVSRAATTKSSTLGKTLNLLIASAARQAKLQIPSDLMLSVSPPTAVSPDGKEIVLTVGATLVYSPQLPDIADAQ